MGKGLLFFSGSLLVTGGLFYYLFSRPVGLSWENLLTRFDPFYAFLYLFLYGLGLWLRTWRYRRLIAKASGGESVPWIPMTLVTAARNMLVDLFPARLGGWSYPLLLNRVVGIDLSHCLTSFAYAFLLDLLSLAPFWMVVVIWFRLQAVGFSFWFGAAVVLLLLAAVGLLFFSASLLERFIPFLEKRLTAKGPIPEGSQKKRVWEEIQAFVRSLQGLQRSRDYGPLLGLSFLIRLTKYALLYLMLKAVVEALLGRPLNLPLGWVLLGLMGSETAASLPVSGLAGIGFYEGFLGAVLTRLGLQTVQGVSLALAMHVLTQVVDYSLGSAALGFLFYRASEKNKLKLHSRKGETGKTAPPDQ
jgi:hypothetical protein